MSPSQPENTELYYLPPPRPAAIPRRVAPPAAAVSVKLRAPVAGLRIGRPRRQRKAGWAPLALLALVVLVLWGGSRAVVGWTGAGSGHAAWTSSR